MYTEIERLTRTIIGRVCKPDVCSANASVTEEIFDNPENLLPVEKITLSSSISAELTKVKEIEKINFFNRAQKHYIAACKHIIHKSGLKSEFLKNCHCLHPSMRKTDASSAEISLIAKKLPLDIKTDVLIDEWNLLKTEEDEPGSDRGRIDTYWNQFSTRKSLRGDPLFPTVCKVAIAVLTVSHGNSDVERGFSGSARVLTDDRASMSERTLNAVMTVKSALKLYDNKAHLVPIDKELLSLAHKAYQSYKIYLEDEKKKKEEEANRKQKEQERKAEEERSKKELKGIQTKILQKEEELKEKRKDEEEKRRTADKCACLPLFVCSWFYLIMILFYF